MLIFFLNFEIYKKVAPNMMLSSSLSTAVPSPTTEPHPLEASTPSPPQHEGHDQRGGGGQQDPMTIVTEQEQNKKLAASLQQQPPPPPPGQPPLYAQRPVRSHLPPEQQQQPPGGVGRNTVAIQDGPTVINEALS